MRKKQSREHTMYTMGLPLLFVTLISLCLIVLTAVALITAKGELDQSKVRVANQEEYMKAANLAEEKIAGKTSDGEATYRIPVGYKGILQVTVTGKKENAKVTGWKVIRKSKDTGESTVSGF